MINANLLALADRVEKLTGPDREIANEVLLACGWICEEHRNGPDSYLTWAPSLDDEDYLDGDQPDPTASLDAAVALVPKGYGFSIDYKVKDHTLCEDTTYACVRDVKKALHGDYATISTEAARHLSPALALTAARLRAIASIDKGEA